MASAQRKMGEGLWDAHGAAEDCRNGGRFPILGSGVCRCAAATRPVMVAACSCSISRDFTFSCKIEEGFQDFPEISTSLSPAADGFKLDPRLPRDWPELTINQIRFQNSVLRVQATCDAMEIRNQTPTTDPIFIRLP